jgi:hypothetical protein
MKILSLKLPASLDAELEAAAARLGTTKSALLREALTSFLAREAGAPPASGSPSASADEVRESTPDYEADEEGDAPSFLSLAGDLAGCVEGPADLSSNPDHLRDFGR